LQARLLNNRLFPSVSSFLSFTAGTGTPALTFGGNKVARQYVALQTLPELCGSGCQIVDGLLISAASKLDVPIITESGSPITFSQPLASSWSSVGVTPADSPSLIWGKSKGHIFDAAESTLGSRPMGFRVVPADRPEVIAVAQNSSGERCLAFNDGAGMSNRWEPFGYLEADYQTGTTTATFTLKVDAATEFIHEWRDPGVSPFLTGPSVVFSGSRGVVVRGQVVAPLPVGEWITITISSTQGAGAALVDGCALCQQHYLQSEQSVARLGGLDPDPRLLLHLQCSDDEHPLRWQMGHLQRIVGHTRIMKM